MHEFSIEYNGNTYTAEYEVVGDTLMVFLPNGECRETQLGGLEPETSAKPHLRSYARSVGQKDLREAQ